MRTSIGLSNGRRFAFLLGSLLAAAGGIVAAQSGEPAPATASLEFKSPAAQQAVKTYTTAADKARFTYDEAMNAARAKLVAGLTTAQTAATKAGDLEDALRIRDALQALRDGGAAAAPAPPSRKKGAGADSFKALLESKWTKTDPDGRIRTMILHPDMSVSPSWHENQGTWTILPDDPRTLRISNSVYNSSGNAYRLSDDGKTLTSSDGNTVFTRLK